MCAWVCRCGVGCDFEEVVRKNLTEMTFEKRPEGSEDSSQVNRKRRQALSRERDCGSRTSREGRSS